MASEDTLVNDLVTGHTPPQPDQFSLMKVSTTTVTCMIDRNINIIDFAKCHPLDEEIIGIKLIYGGGKQTVVRGNSKVSKKARDFYNQVTFSLRLPPDHSVLVSCKIFHNGRLHVTGARQIEDAKRAVYTIIRKLETFHGIRSVSLKKFDKQLDKLLIGYDNLIYSCTGKIIGWIRQHDDDTTIILKGDVVEPDVIESTSLGSEISVLKSDIPILKSAKWSDGMKTLYNLDGDVIGTARLEMEFNISKRHFDVKHGYVFVGDRIVGKEIIEYVPDWENLFKDASHFRSKFHEARKVIHPYKGILDDSPPVHLQDLEFEMHMINVGFNSPYPLAKDRLHECFVRDGYYSKYDPCSNPGCNLIFRYYPDYFGTDKAGQCPCLSMRSCTCKRISATCFNTGKINIVGLQNLDQGKVVYDFLVKYLTEHRSEVEHVKSY